MITKNLLISAMLATLLSTQLFALPPQVEADRLGLAAKTAMDAKEYKTAVEKLEAMQKLGVKLPDTFSYHYGTALLETGKYSEALKMFDSYLAQGQRAKFYKEALGKYNFAEEKYKLYGDFFRDDANNVVVDPIQKLMWQDEEYTSQDKYNHDNFKEGGKVWKGEGAIHYCQNLTLAEYSDWRLPSVAEMSTIHPNRSGLAKVFHHTGWRYKEDERGGFFATSTTGNKIGYKYVADTCNWVNEDGATYENYVRCVRDSK